MNIADRLRWAWLTGAVVLLALLATAFLREHPAQPWIAGVAVVALIALRLLWRCPHCKMPLSAVPMTMTECRRCGNSL
jgi:hypothetical protein